MNKLVVVLVILFGFVGPTFAGDLWWSVATGYKEFDIGPPRSMPVYGAAWNFPDKASAEAAAMKECKSRWTPCAINISSKNRCFAVGRYKKLTYVDRETGEIYDYYSVIYQNTKDKLMESIKWSEKHNPLWGPFKAELIKCSGAK